MKLGCCARASEPLVLSCCRAVTLHRLSCCRASPLVVSRPVGLQRPSASPLVLSDSPPGGPRNAQFPKATALLPVFTPRRDDNVRPSRPITGPLYDQNPSFVCARAFHSHSNSSSDTKTPPVMHANHSMEPPTPADNASRNAMSLRRKTCTISQCKFCRPNSRASALLVWRLFTFW